MSIKINCSNPACQQRIAVEEAMAGRSVSCPVCGTVLQIPTSTSIRFNCSNPGCGQHIVVDVGEAGRFVRCPSCDKTMQVPGSPPKSFLSGQTITLPTYASASSAKKTPFPAPAGERRTGILKMPVVLGVWRLLKGWVVGAAISGLLVAGVYVRSSTAVPRNLDAMADEIYFTGELRDAPVVSHDTTELLCARDVKTGVGVFLIDLTSPGYTELTRIDAADQARDRAFKLIGWSQDDQYFAFSLIKNGGRNRTVAVYDASTRKEVSSFDASDTVEQGAWLNASSLIVVDHSHRCYLYYVGTNAQVARSGKKGAIELGQIGHGTSYWLTPDSDHSIAYVDNGNLWDFDILTSRSLQLTHLRGSTLEWVDYSATKDRYLFCATESGSKERYVYEYDPRAVGRTNASQLSDNYSFKAQWVLGGSGFAYVATQGDRSFLNLETWKPPQRRKLFAGGFVHSYSVSPKGDKLYMIAAIRDEPLDIWEYDITNRTLRSIVSCGSHSYDCSRFVPPIQAWTTNGLGEKVDYYILPPAHVVASKKYPVIMDQFSDGRYQQNFQFLANAGIFYVTVNRYGMASDTHPTRLEDTSAVYAELLKNPNIDPHRIYVDGRSAGTIAVCDMLKDHPELWRGAIFSSPEELPRIPDDGKAFPRSVFISMGDEDDFGHQAMSEKFVASACGHHVRAQLVYGHGGHTFSSTDQLKERYKAIAKFVLTDFGN